MEDLVGDRDLADVVKQRGGADPVHLGVPQTEVPSHGRRHLDHGLGVLAGVSVALGERDRQRLDCLARPSFDVPRAPRLGSQCRLTATRPLRVPARDPSAGQQGFGTHLALQSGDSHRDAHPADDALARLLELGDQPLQRVAGVLVARIREQDPELV